MWIISILTTVLKSIVDVIKGSREAAKQSEIEALKGRAESVEESFNEQDKAGKEANDAVASVRLGSKDDVFGSGEK